MRWAGSFLVIFLLLGGALSGEPRPGGFFSLEVGEEGAGPINLSPSIQYWIQPGGESRSPLDPGFTPSWRVWNNSTFNLGFREESIWLRITLSNSSRKEFRGYLAFNWPLLDRVDLYSPSLRTGSLQKLFSAGDKIHISRWPVRVTDPTFPLRLESGETRLLLARVRSSKRMRFRVLLYSPNDFLSSIRNHALFSGGLVNALFLIALYNLLIFFRVRQMPNLYLTLSLLCLGLVVLVVQGYAYPLLWPDFPGWHSLSLPVLLTLALFLNLLFVRDLLEIADHRSWLNWIFLGLALVLIVFIALLLLAPPSLYIVSRVLILFSSLFLALLLLAGVKQYKRLIGVARLLVVGWSLFAFGASLQLLVVVWEYPREEIFRTLFLGSLPVIFLLFTLANYERIRLLQKRAKRVQERLRHSVEPLQEESSSSYRKSHLKHLDSDHIARRIVQLMEEEHLYQVEDLKAPALAQLLDITPHQLSEIFSSKFKSSFPLFLRDYRIRKACELLQGESNRSIIQVAYECGFGSKTSFNRSFKEETGLTPGEYRQFNFTKSD